MKLIPLSELFDAKYGVNLERNRMTPDVDGVAFVGRSDYNNGITGRVALVPGVDPLPAGTITVAGGGNSVLASFVQLEPYYTGRDVYYLTEKVPMTLNQKLYYCVCIKTNRYRYNYGRQANRTLRDLHVPALSDLPAWVDKADPTVFDSRAEPAVATTPPALGDPMTWKPFEYQDLFMIERGRGPRRKDLDGTGTTPFVSAIDSNNGFTGVTPMAPIHSGNVISVNRNGNGVADAFYQPVPFCSTEDVHIFVPQFEMTPAVGLFLATLIRQEKYRFNYGRKWGIERMKKSVIRLPVGATGQPDWPWMEEYIKTLPYSSQID